MGFKVRRKGRYEGVEKFVMKIKEIQGEAKVALGKAQEEMKKYMDRKRAEVNEYRVGDLVMLSTKDLKYKMVGRRAKGQRTMETIKEEKEKEIEQENLGI